MSFYRWRRSSRAAGYEGVNEHDDRLSSWDEEEGLLPADPRDWKPPRLKQYLGEGPKLGRPRHIGDLTGVGQPLIVGERAVDVLCDILMANSMLYPVILTDDPKGKYWMVVVTTCLGWDCLSQQGTEYGKHPDGRIYAVKKWNFKEDQLTGHDLFRLPNSRVVQFVSQRFVDRVLEAKLTGFCFDRTYLDSAITA